MTQTLIDRGFAYAAEGNVWFDVTKDADYGKLSNRRLAEQEAGTRELAGAGKRNPADFALWKAAKPGEPSWESPWGPGRPGWHIECSAMSVKYLGETFDIHGGGMDLMFPHHENELAQSECCTGKPFARFWLHNGLTRVATKLPGGQVATEKMSKSLGNVLDPTAFVAEHGAELLRYVLLGTHYRSPIDFSDEVIKSSKQGLSGLDRVFDGVRALTGREIGQAPATPDARPAPDINGAAAELLDTPLGPFVRRVLQLEMKFLEMLDDDFNTAAAIGVLHELATEIRQVTEGAQASGAGASAPEPQLVTAVSGAGETFRKLGLILGLFRSDRRAARSSGWETVLQNIRVEAQAKGHATLVETIDKKVSREMEKGIEDFIQARADARKNKDFAAGDFIRDVLARNGYRLEDHAGGTRWSTIG